MLHFLLTRKKIIIINNRTSRKEHECIYKIAFIFGVQLVSIIHRYKGQLCVDRRICCCSQFMIFLFELLGPAKQPMACPSSSNRKIMNWEQQQILLSTHNCPLYLWINPFLKRHLKHMPRQKLIVWYIHTLVLIIILQNILDIDCIVLLVCIHSIINALSTYWKSSDFNNKN